MNARSTRTGKRLFRDPRALLGGGALLLVVLLCFPGPILLPHDPNTQTPGLGASAPLATLVSLQPQGTDGSPRILSRREFRTVVAAADAWGFEPGPNPIGTGYWVEPSVFFTPPSGKRLPPVWIPLDRWDAAVPGIARATGLETAPGISLRDPPLTLPDVLSVSEMTASILDQRHLLGTDPLGRDLLQRILVGGRLSLAVGLCATLVAVGIGVVYGGIAGYVGGRLDGIMMRLVDAIYAIPFVIFVILLVMLFERNLLLLFAAIGAVEWLTMARIVRGQVMALKDRPFIEAARVSGTPPTRILFHHILPNCLGVIIVYATLTVPTVILLESVLSFLGLGVPPPAASWGVLIEEGAERVRTDPWLLIGPAGLFALTLLALNILGDALRDAFDPRR